MTNLLQTSPNDLNNKTTCKSDKTAFLDISNLLAGYHNKEIVHGISFSVNAGEFVCIIGANGCGKTTALKTILGLLKPFGGSICVNGTNTIKLTQKQLARHFAYIPQAHAAPFPFKVADVVLLGRTPYINSIARVSEHDREIALNALYQLDIADLAERTYTHLSGGQQQLVLIARALTQEPDVLVMDEPTASLDFGNQQTVLSRMRSLVDAGTSVLMVTHDPGHAFYCADRVLVMHEGLIIANGSAHDVITTECLQTIYGTKVKVTEVELEEGGKTSVCIPLR
ncbi:MAG: ABC transporter ATP-binding protein [Coriobacteriales bacterium]|nr:ABC transporter ATP-binding protein [Coriobacteriales bacterium]